MANSMEPLHSEPFGAGSGVSSPPGPGRVLNGRYELGAVVGRGGMGVVYRAIDRQHPERALAVKCLDAASVNESSLGLFKTEFKAMSDMRHPNLARVYDFEPIRGTGDHFFTMDFVDGTTVLDAARDATPAAILPLVVQVCRALSYVHSRGLIHKDLKPANILVDAAGTVKVLDFGLVGVRARDGATPFTGTPAYAAPEVVAGTRTLDHRADLYSLGITWYELLCGRLPFQGANVTEMFALHLTEPLRFDDDARARVPEWMRAIIERLCEKHPADRFRSGNAVIEAINAAGSHGFEVETSATRDSYFFAGRFVGREAHLGTLSGFMDERLGDGAAPLEPVFVVAGPSGSGKSRLMLEVRHRAQLSNAVFVEADCYDGSLSEHEPIITIVEGLASLAEGIGATDLMDRFAPSLALLDPRFGRGRALTVASVDNPDAARVAMIARIGEFMVAVADRVPYAVYVNDLQWARAGTLDVLLNVSRLVALRERGGRRVCLAIFGSCRDDEVPGRPVESWLRELRENHELRTMRVEPLARDDVSVLLGSMLGIDELPDSFVDRVARETAGNPFFIREVMRSLVERGLVYLERGRWSADRPIGVLEIPPSVAAVFEHRLAQLGPREHDVLELVAAYGRPMPLSLIAAVARLDDDGLGHIVLGLLRRQMIARGTIDGQACCWPIHDRIRELAYARLDRPTRLRLHRALAEALEAGASGDAPLAELARQWWAAEDREKALHYCVLGGREAKRRHALQTGIELLDQALQLLPEGDAAQRTALEEELAEMLALSGDFERAATMYDRLLPHLAGAVDRARVLRELGSITFRRGDTPAGRQSIWQALALLNERRPRSRPALLAQIALAALHHFLLRFVPFARRVTGDRTLCAAKADCYLALVYPSFFSDPFEAVLVVLRGANFATRAGDGPQLSFAYSFLGTVFYGIVLGRFDTALEYGRRAGELADRLELPLHRALAVHVEMFVRHLTGEWEAGGAAALEGARLFRTHGDMYAVGGSYCMLLLSYIGRGMLHTARQTAQEGLEIVERVGALAVSTPVSMKHGMLLVDLGSPELGLPKVHAAYDAAEQMGDALLRAWVRLFLGHCYFATGDLDTAIEYLESCVAIRRHYHLGADFLSNRVHPLLARAYVDLARQSPDAATRQELLRRARRNAVAGMRSMRRRATYRAAALLAMAESRWEDGREAEAHSLFDQAIAFAEKQGSPLMLADAHFELGRRERRTEDARRHLRAALELYDACEAMPYLQQVQRALGSLDTER